MRTPDVVSYFLQLCPLTYAWEHGGCYPWGCGCRGNTHIEHILQLDYICRYFGIGSLREAGACQTNLPIQEVYMAVGEPPLTQYLVGSSYSNQHYPWHSLHVNRIANCMTNVNMHPASPQPVNSLLFIRAAQPDLPPLAGLKRKHSPYMLA